MRRVGLVVLVCLVAGILVLVWGATTVVLTGETIDVAASAPSDVSTTSAPPIVRHELSKASAPSAEHDVPAASVSKSVTVPAKTEEVPTSMAIEREGALETIAARVHGVALAQFAREVGVAPTEVRRPVPEARVSFVVGERVLATAVSGRDGRFEARFEVQGACEVVLEAPEGWRAVQARRALRKDELAGRVAVELRFLHAERDPASIGGDVRGVLQSESGAWTAESLPKRGAVLLDLVSVKDPNVSMRAEVVNGQDASGAPTVEFRFADVPKGEWELTLSALDSFRWHPTSLRVSPPAEGLEFLRYDKERVVPVEFRVVDAVTREAVAGFQARRLSLSVSGENGVFLHTGPIELGTFSVQGGFSWSVWSEGYVPAFGDERCFVEENGKRVAEVVLERGWGTKVLALARDPVARPLVNAEVVVDGRSVGRTGSDGMLVVTAEKAPKTMEVRADGMVLVGNPLAPYQGRSAEQRGCVTLAFLAPRE